MKTMNKKFQSIEQRTGMRFIGECDTKIEVELTDTDRIELGASSAKAVKEIRILENDLADYGKKIKGKIHGLRTDIQYFSTILNNGHMEEARALPCFYDSVKQERVYFDPENGEEVKRDKAQPGDNQMKFDDAR